MAYRLGVRCVVANETDATWAVNELTRDVTGLLNAGTDYQTASFAEYNVDATGAETTPTGRQVAIAVATFQRRGDAQRIQSDLQNAVAPVLSDPRVISYMVIQNQD